MQDAMHWPALICIQGIDTLPEAMRLYGLTFITYRRL